MADRIFNAEETYYTTFAFNFPTCLYTGLHTHSSVYHFGSTKMNELLHMRRSEVVLTWPTKPGSQPAKDDCGQWGALGHRSAVFLSTGVMLPPYCESTLNEKSGIFYSGITPPA